MSKNGSTETCSKAVIMIQIALNMSSFLSDLNIPILKTKNALVKTKFHQRNVLIFLTAFTTIKHQEMMAFLSNSTNNSGL